MKMNRAWNSRMLIKQVGHAVATPGYYDDDNYFVESRTESFAFWGVNLVGNKFSQFQEGQAVVPTNGGDRNSNYRTLFIETRWRELELDDKVTYRGKHYNILRKSSEIDYGFFCYLIEESKDWKPPTP